jgi:hypothetical protein
VFHPQLSVSLTEAETESQDQRMNNAPSPATGQLRPESQELTDGMYDRVYFKGVGKGVLSPPPPPLGIDLPPLGIGFPYICNVWLLPLGFVFAPPLKFAAMYLPHLERNPEINPV